MRKSTGPFRFRPQKTGSRLVHAGRWFLVLLFICGFLINSTAGSAATKRHVISRGKATWYGVTAHGKLTASGELFNRYALTAAHRKLPFGSVIRVYNLVNGRHVLVKVTDRGPFSKNCVVDVSFRAAEALNMTDAGTTQTVVELVSDQDGQLLNNKNSFYVHLLSEVTALRTRFMAANLEKRLKKPVRTLMQPQEKGTAFALCLGPFGTFDQAHQEFLRLESRKISLRGIIEAPSNGNRMPRYNPPRRKKAGNRHQTGSFNQCFLKGTSENRLFAPWLRQARFAKESNMLNILLLAANKNPHFQRCP